MTSYLGRAMTRSIHLEYSQHAKMSFTDNALIFAVKKQRLTLPCTLYRVYLVENKKSLSQSQYKVRPKKSKKV